MKELRLQYPLPFLCRMFGVSASGYHAWLTRPVSRRAREEGRLEMEIKAAHKRARETYGPERLQQELRAQGGRDLPDQKDSEEAGVTVHTEAEVQGHDRFEA